MSQVLRAPFRLIAKGSDPNSRWNTFDFQVDGFPLVAEGLTWHWQATVPGLPADTESIVIVCSIHARSVMSANNLWDAYYAIDGGSQRFLSGGPFSVPTYFKWVDPKMLPGNYTQPTYIGAPFATAYSWWVMGRGPNLNPGDTSGSVPFVEPPSEDIYLRAFMLDGSEVGGPAFQFTRPGWTSVLTPSGASAAIYNNPPWPHTVDVYFNATAMFSGLDIPGGGQQPIKWMFPDLSLYVVAVEPVSVPPPTLVPGHIHGGPGKEGEKPSGQTTGQAGAGNVTAPPAQGQYSIEGLVLLALSVGVLGDNAAMAGAIGMAESGGNPSATNVNPGPPESVDRGLWQINNVYHPEVSDACAFDPQCNARGMKSISSGGTNWTPWSTYGNGAYLRFIDAAHAALAKLGA